MDIVDRGGTVVLFAVLMIIAKAMSQNAHVLIMDEPSALLTNNEIKK